MYQKNQNRSRSYTYGQGQTVVGSTAPQMAAVPVATPMPQQQTMPQFQGQMQIPPQAPAQPPVQPLRQTVQQPIQQPVMQPAQQPATPPPQNLTPPYAHSGDNSECVTEEEGAEPSFAGQICKIGGRNKFLSFHNELTLAAKPNDHEGDYAAIHGQGGKNHAVRSRIEVRMCDYSQKPSSNTKYNLEPYYCLYLLEIVKTAMNGNLAKGNTEQAAKTNAIASGVIVGWLKAGYQPNQNDLSGLYKMLSEVPQEANSWRDWKEKNNPYPSACKMVNGTEYTPVQTFNIQYDPSRNYQWTVTVSNFIAPISRDKKRGTSSHNSKQAAETKSVSISMTTEDLYKALTQVEHFIGLWEYRTYPMINAMCGKKEQEAEARRNAARAGAQ